MIDVRGKRVLVVGLGRSGRAVTLLLHQHGATVTVNFADGVQGTKIAEGSRIAVAFHQQTDTPFADNAVAVSVRATSQPPVLSKGACFDADGRELADVNLVWGS